MSTLPATPADPGPCETAQQAADTVREICTAVRQDKTELDERLAAELVARTVDDLIRVVRDLPSEVTG